MLRRILFLLCSFIAFSHSVTAQTLYGFAGAGLGYDAFLRDAAITRYKKDWPLEMGIQTAIGLRYQTGQSFDALFDISTGSMRIIFPAPGGGESKASYELVQCLFMAGSGVHVSVNEQNIVMPFIQIGAGFFDNSGFASSDRILLPAGNRDLNTNKWLPVIGGGIDWQFRLLVPASFNLRFIYTPLSFFDEPVPYTYNKGNHTEDLLLQGKILQTIFTFRVYLKMAKWEPKY